MFDIGKKIKLARACQGIKQTELAKKAKLSQSLIVGFEKEIKSPSLKSLSKLAAVLKIPASEFLIDFKQFKKKQIERVK